MFCSLVGLGNYWANLRHLCPGRPSKKQSICLSSLLAFLGCFLWILGLPIRLRVIRLISQWVFLSREEENKWHPISETRQAFLSLWGASHDPNLQCWYYHVHLSWQVNYVRAIRLSWTVYIGGVCKRDMSDQRADCESNPKVDSCKDTD